MTVTKSLRKPEKKADKQSKMSADIQFDAFQLCPTHGSFRNPLEVSRWLYKNNEAKKGSRGLIQSNKCYGRFGTYLNKNEKRCGND